MHAQRLILENSWPFFAVVTMSYSATCAARLQLRYIYCKETRGTNDRPSDWGRWEWGKTLLVFPCTLPMKQEMRCTSTER